MRTLLLFLAALLVIAAALPVGASAQDNSAIDEYIEGVPEGGGEQPSDEQGGGTPGSADGTPGSADGTPGSADGTPGSADGESTPLAPGTSQDLGSKGADGAAAAELAEATAPSHARERGGFPRERGGSPRNSSTDPEGGLPSVGDVVGGISGSGSGGLGAALPIILGVALLVALALVAARRFRGTEDTDQA